MRDELRIEQITLTNYRQYYGKVVVKFSTEKNVFSILVGTNGAGKSNLWNAIHWCLFGVEPHIKSADKPPIINKKYLQEKNDGMLLTSVEIIMVSNNDKYRIRRKLTGLLHSTEMDAHGNMVMLKNDPVPKGFEIMEHDKSELFQISKNGGKWESKIKNHDFKNVVNEHIIQENLAKFFILDGEFLQDLFSEFDNIKTGIDQISQISILNKTIEHVGNIRFASSLKGNDKLNEIRENMGRYERNLASEGKIGKRLVSRTELVYDTDDYMHQMGRPRESDLKKSITNMDKRLRVLDKMIKDSNAQSKLEIKDKHALASKNKDSTEKALITVIQNHTSHLIADGPLMMCKASLELATDLIVAEMDKGNLPNASKRMLVDDLLAQNACLCGASLELGTDARKHVEHEMERIADEVQYDIANDMRFNNQRFAKGYAGMVSRMNEDMETIQGKKRELVSLNEELRALERRLSTDNKEYASWINEASRLRSQRDEQQLELGKVTRDIEQWVAAKADEMRRLQVAESRMRGEQEAILVMQKSNLVENTLQEIKKDVDKTIRDKVAKETLRVYNDMTWKKNYHRLWIDGKYRISMAGSDSVEIVGGMSAGESLFLALSFIMALKKITNYRFPFIIDSPLGKIGGSMRINFGTYMPELLDGSQLIMLATNSEYNYDKIQPDDGSEATHTLKELLEQKGNVREYEIDFDKEAETASIIVGRRP